MVSFFETRKPESLRSVLLLISSFFTATKRTDCVSVDFYWRIFWARQINLLACSPRCGTPSVKGCCWKGRPTMGSGGMLVKQYYSRPFGKPRRT
jgi:hypothetical protein